jgi:hypothetical protein
LTASFAFGFASEAVVTLKARESPAVADGFTLTCSEILASSPGVRIPVE